MELGVAVMLVALGVATLWNSRNADPFNRREDGPGAALGPIAACRPDLGLTTRMAARQIVVGVVHGLAGSAAVTLLVLSTIHDPRWALLYLLIFGLGTVAGMVTLTTAIALPFAFTARRFGLVNEWLGRATGLASIVLGILIAYRLFAAHGLFLSRLPLEHCTLVSAALHNVDMYCSRIA